MGPRTMAMSGVNTVSRRVLVTGLMTAVITPTICSWRATCASMMGWIPGITFSSTTVFAKSSAGFEPDQAPAAAVVQEATSIFRAAALAELRPMEPGVLTPARISRTTSRSRSMTKSLASISAGERSKRKLYQNPRAVLSLLNAISNARCTISSESPEGLACHVAFSNTEIHSSCSAGVSHAMCHARRSSSQGVKVMPLGFLLLSFAARYPEQLIHPFFSLSRHLSEE
mmetsp:Transcript_47477/g.95650  ORF Transcript_47477/g.95650 Transcript_47477/m.95650 type:complete len:228 (+) Transcript_47477:205-888(+)